MSTTETERSHRSIEIDLDKHPDLRSSWCSDINIKKVVLLPQTVEQGGSILSYIKEMTPDHSPGWSWKISENLVKGMSLDPALVGKSAYWVSPSAVEKFLEDQRNDEALSALREHVTGETPEQYTERVSAEMDAMRERLTGEGASPEPIFEPRPVLDAQLTAVKDDRERLEAQLGEAQREVAGLKEQVEGALVEQNRQTDLARAARRTHELEITTIGEKLMEEAESREWCEQYDTFVADLSKSLSFPLPVRIRDFEVSVQVTFDTTMTVSASTADDARDQVNNGSYAEQISSNIAHEDWTDFDVTDVSE